MTDRPILFSAPMVRALLAGAKTQTRRIVKPQPSLGRINAVAEMEGKLRFAAGDRLWVREAWRTELGGLDYLAPSALAVGTPLLYEADAAWGDNHTVGRLRPGMFMPRWASRISLLVSAVRIERLQEISEADAAAEGIGDIDPARGNYNCGGRYTLADQGPRLPEALWSAINGADSWAANPWVCVLTFTKAEPNAG